MSQLAFYIVFGFGHPPVKEVFKSPLQSLMDVMIMSQHDLNIVYSQLILTKYSVVGQVEDLAICLIKRGLI